MPSTYAHHRFGTALLRTMPGDVRRTISRFPRLFDVGLQGPDIFYYSSPLLKTNTSFLGIRFHEQTGQEFFQRVCRVVRLINPRLQRPIYLVCSAITVWTVFARAL